MIGTKCLFFDRSTTPSGPATSGLPARRRSYFFETIANAVKRLDHIELDVACLELPAQPLDVTVHGPFIHIDLIVIAIVTHWSAEGNCGVIEGLPGIAPLNVEIGGQALPTLSR